MYIKNIKKGFISVDEIGFQNLRGKPVVHECVRRSDSVGVLLIDEVKNAVLFIRQSRVACLLNDDEPQLEIIAGMIDSLESPVAAVIRETQEETGYVLTPPDLFKIGSYYLNIGMTDEICHLFIGSITNKTRHSQKLDGDEDIILMEYDLDVVKKHLATISKDSKTQIALGNYFLLKQLNDL